MQESIYSYAMDKQTLEKYINNHKLTLPYKQARQAYYQGRHPAINRDPAKPAPDHRISVPLVRLAVDMTGGYIAKPGNVQYENLPDQIQDTFDGQEESLLTSNLFKIACIHGEAWELHWYQDGIEQMAIVPYDQAIPVWSDELKPVLLAFIRYYKITDIDGTEKEKAVVYDASTVEYWDIGNGAIEETEAHGFGQVPAVRFRIEYTGQNLFDHVLELQDGIDRLYSHDIGNELEKFANAYLLIRDRLTQEDIDNLKVNAIFQGLGDNVTTAVSFLTKNIPTEFLEFSATKLAGMFWKCMSLPGSPDDEKAGVSSGYAKMLENMNFEFLCASIEGNFIRGLQDRIRLMAGHSLSGVDGTDTTVRMTRNMPFDMESTVRSAAQLAGIWDLEAILGLFPTLSDEAKARILESKQAEKEAAMALFGGNGNDDGQDENAPPDAV